jgi:hypothetical protein
MQDQRCLGLWAWGKVDVKVKIEKFRGSDV